MSQDVGGSVHWQILKICFLHTTCYYNADVDWDMDDAILWCLYELRAQMAATLQMFPRIGTRQQPRCPRDVLKDRMLIADATGW